MDDGIVEIVLRYNGYWRNIVRTGRRKYECGHQKTLRIDTKNTSLKKLEEQISEFLPTAKGNVMKLVYTIPETNPRRFATIKSDRIFMGVLKDHLEKKRVEMFLTLESIPRINEMYDGDNEQEGYDCDGGYDWGLANEQNNEMEINEEQNFEIGDVNEGCSHEGDVGIQVDNVESCSDDADDCHSINEYHSVHSSEVEESSEDEVDQVRSMEGFVYQTNVEDPEFALGKKFKDIKYLRFCLQQHSIKKDFNYQLVKNEPKRFVVKCKKERCPWRLRAKRLPYGKTMEISVFEGLHTCTGVNKCGNFQATADWVAQNILGDVKSNPNITPKDIIRLIQSKFEMTLNYNRAWRGREKARDIIFGNIEATYDLVLSLKHELLKRNPGSHVEVQLEPDHAFQRMFVCLGASIEGFKHGIRPFMGLDGCHLRSKYLGTLLAATALDGNNGLFLIAFAIVEGESGNSWYWFLQNLLQAFHGDIGNISIISDQEKGLLEAVSVLLPQVEHRACIRHLWKNFKKDFPGDFFEQTVWDAARAYTSEEFNDHMKALDNVSHQAYIKLASKDRFVWSRSQFTHPSRNHNITNNLSESLNSWILDARFLPVVDLVDKLRGKLMEKFNKRRTLGHKWKGKLVPVADRYCQDISKRLGGYKVFRTNDKEAEVENQFERRTINLRERTCSCRQWQITGLPCIHVANFVGSIRNADWPQFCDPYYSIQSYRMAYAKSVGVMPSRDQWEPYDKDFTIGPPHAKRPRGRPKKKRMRGRDKNEPKQVDKRKHKCTRCGALGHHKNTCKQPLKRNQIPQEQSQASGRGHVQEQPPQASTTRLGESISRMNKLHAIRGRGRALASGRGTTYHAPAPAPIYHASGPPPLQDYHALGPHIAAATQASTQASSANQSSVNQPTQPSTTSGFGKVIWK